jgi:diguanylate cyclase (GGDEF)-like protein
MFTSLATALLLSAKLEFVAPDANFSVREGLPAVQVLSLYQDKHGGLWAGTTAGVAQLGGPVIRTFGAPQGLSRSEVSAIAEEPSGSLVVGTAGGIFRLVGDHFEAVALPTAAVQAGVKRFVQAGDGTLWALAGERILLRHMGGAWDEVGIDGALAFEANDFAVDEAGAMWLATRNHGLLRLSRAGTRFRKSAEFHPEPGVVVPIDHVSARGGKIYFTSSRGVSSVVAGSKDAVLTRPFPEGASAGERALSVTAAGRVFVATNTGVFTVSDEALVPVESRNDRARSAALCLLSDREGQLWMGTIESGLNVLLMGRGVRFLRADKEGFRSIEIDRSGLHWVSNERRVLTFRTDGDGAPASVAEARFEGFDALMIYGIAEDPSGALLFAMNGGVGILPAEARKSGDYVVRSDPRFAVLSDRPVSSLHRDAGGAIWAVSPIGVYRLMQGRPEPESVPIHAGNPSQAALDDQGFLWVATRQGTMTVIDTEAARATEVTLPAGRHVEFVAASPDGGAVVTFENGRSAFFSAKRPSGDVTLTDGPEGISWLSVRSLQKMGEFYLAAHEGDRLSQIRLNPARVGQTILTSADLEDSDFRYLGLHEGRAGQVWFTLLNGIGLLDPPNAPPEPSPLRLSPRIDSLTLSPRPNQIDLYAELSDPVAARKARYRFRLLGQTETWSEWSGDPHIPLVNVPPGEYRLEIEAEDRYGRRGQALSVAVRARGHFWESWSFRITSLLLSLGGVYLLYGRRVRAIEQDRLDLAAAVGAGRADLEVANQRLQELSLTDMLTGLRNRRYFSEVVEDELRLLKRRYDERHSGGDPNRDAVFFLLDLDRFKTVNDLFGHAGGDLVLKETARRLNALLRKTDRFIRWGGEEFLVLSLDSQRSEAPEMAARMMSAISHEPFPVGPAPGIHITTSLGWAAYPFLVDGAEPHPEDVVRLADRALYRAKRAGRNCAVGAIPALAQVEATGTSPATVELLKDLGISVTFTMVRGETRPSDRGLDSLRESGPVRRPF